MRSPWDRQCIDGAEIAVPDDLRGNQWHGRPITHSETLLDPKRRGQQSGSRQCTPPCTDPLGTIVFAEQNTAAGDSEGDGEEAGVGDSGGYDRNPMGIGPLHTWYDTRREYLWDVPDELK